MHLVDVYMYMYFTIVTIPYFVTCNLKVFDFVHVYFK